MRPDVAAVVIGRNEGERLRRCLQSIAAEGIAAVYADSGSTDGSVALARSLGVPVVELDPRLPFTAARGRNAGFAALQQSGRLPPVVQFLDGDCQLEPGWIAAGLAHLEANPGTALVTGWRTELAPEASAYHQLAEIEWRQPPGEIRACGGDMMVRSAVVSELGGFAPEIIASEDEDFVLRLRAAGHMAWRLERVMTRHDIGAMTFRGFWRRHLRSGHGFAEVGLRHPGHFARERRRAVLFGFAMPATVLVALGLGAWWLKGLALLVLLAGNWRTWAWLRRSGRSRREALPLTGLIAASRIANFAGMARFWFRRVLNRQVRLIEYK